MAPSRVICSFFANAILSHCRKNIIVVICKSSASKNERNLHKIAAVPWEKQNYETFQKDKLYIYWQLFSCCPIIIEICLHYKVIIGVKKCQNGRGLFRQISFIRMFNLGMSHDGFRGGIAESLVGANVGLHFTSCNGCLIGCSNCNFTIVDLHE